MTIDEAIVKYNKLANNDRTCHPEEAQQLAEWLEELKAYQRQHITICEKYGINTIEDLYNKAIDDFAELIHKKLYIYDTIDDLAEQLKVGGENDN